MTGTEAFHAATGEPAKYQCAACKEPVFLIQGEALRIYRPCGCQPDTGVLANISAIAYGEGGAEQ